MKESTGELIFGCCLIGPFLLIGVVFVTQGDPNGWVLVIPMVLLLVWRFREWRKEVWWEDRCSRCKQKWPEEDLVKILHGMGPESDSWVENICPKCAEAGVPTHETLLTRHRIQ